MRRTPEADDATDAWLDKVESIAELAVEHRDRGEADRRMPPELNDALRAAGFARMMVPRHAGGEQESLTTATRVVEELARLDGSLGWVGWVTIGHGRLADLMSTAATSAVYDHGEGVVAGSILNTGTATRVPGGYRLTGQWSFASGCHGADYFLTGGSVVEDGKKVIIDGEPLLLALLLPPSECEILDTWHTTGLSGTGSHDIRVDDVFVADEFTFRADGVWQVLDSDGVGYGRPYSEYSPPMMAAVALGIAQHAIDEFKAMVEFKNRQQEMHWMARLPNTNAALGRAEATVQAARSFLYENVRLLASLEPGDAAMGLQSQMVGRYVAEQSAVVVDDLYEAGGGFSIYKRNQIERCFRDVRMVTHHGLISSVTYGNVGQAMTSGS
ncbi:putative oxidoreductase [Ilumatobacter coccineus YM16-304]|uniref:Putative oxidoreductase n=1 Tax=Ilumatobacter coccineus (strain NBRC 103263 / KCTC 29153 / YM16-304) TaxID=1313172 RepID=A0A6C7E967_ILUCY|nr:putative oxidoreductase [Ilumatobacter coccineus YM16-304]